MPPISTTISGLPDVRVAEPAGHGESEVRFRREGHLLRRARLDAPFPFVGPALGQVQLPIDELRPFAGNVGDEYAEDGPPLLGTVMSGVWERFVAAEPGVDFTERVGDKMTGKLTGKVAVVTGAASGIGRACAERLAKDGAHVALFDLDGGEAKGVADKIQTAGGSAHAWTVDVADRENIDSTLAEVRARYGSITILVNSAGKEGFKRFLNISLESWNQILTVNLTGTFHCCQAVVPDMIAAGWGRIVNISSSSAHSGQPFMTHYVASKAGVMGFTKALALELGPAGVTVNTIPPGFIDTPMMRRGEKKGYLGEGGAEYHATQTPVRRAGRAEDIAAACAFLVSEEAGYITGQIIGVNGGRNT